MDDTTRSQASLRHFNAISEIISDAGIDIETDARSLHGMAILAAALELFRDIAWLFDSGRHLAAMALLRSSVEYTFRGYWMLLAASNEDLDDFIQNDRVTELVKNGKRQFLGLAEMMRAVENAPPLDTAAGDGIAKYFDREQDLYQRMCSHSHGGMVPIRMRLSTADGSAQMTDKDVDIVLDATDYTAVLAALLMCEFTGKFEHAAALYDLHLSSIR